MSFDHSSTDKEDERYQEHLARLSRAKCNKDRDLQLEAMEKRRASNEQCWAI